jgi:hypothetical protein
VSAKGKEANLRTQCSRLSVTGAAGTSKYRGSGPCRHAALFAWLKSRPLHVFGTGKGTGVREVNRLEIPKDGHEINIW